MFGCNSDYLRVQFLILKYDQVILKGYRKASLYYGMPFHPSNMSVI